LNKLQQFCKTTKWKILNIHKLRHQKKKIGTDTPTNNNNNTGSNNNIIIIVVIIIIIIIIVNNDRGKDV